MLYVMAEIQVVIENHEVEDDSFYSTSGYWSGGLSILDRIF